MNYKALYRVFRPKTFGEVVGQEHIIAVLKNQVKTNHISHAYLFTGSRGTGKTSIARIFARAISCNDTKDGEACLECKLCKESLSETGIDIIEIDAASNNGIDEIRELRENVKYAPAVGKYKVYIIDEVHMLSSGAFNALLKTLEEPPAHCVFILATTEPQKLPETIISRCQRFDFHKIDSNAIVNRLKEIGKEVGAKCDEDALMLIASFAKGGLRDAISLLDQCIAFFDGAVTKDAVLNIIGHLDNQDLFTLTDYLINGDAKGGINYLNIIKAQNPGLLCSQWIEHLRALLLFSTTNNAGDILGIVNHKPYIEQSKRANGNMLLRSIKIFSKAANDLKYSFVPMVFLEVAIADVCTPEISEDKFAILERLEKLEEKLKNGNFTKGETLVKESEPTPITKAEVKSDVKIQPLKQEKPRAKEPLTMFSDMPPFDISDEEIPFKYEDEAIPPFDVEDNQPVQQIQQVHEPQNTVEVDNEALKADDAGQSLPAGDFTKEHYKQLMAVIKKKNKGLYVSLKDSFFGGFNANKLWIYYPDENCQIFMDSAMKRKKNIIEELQIMGFNDVDICAKIENANSKQSILDMFGEDNVKFTD